MMYRLVLVVFFSFCISQLMGRWSLLGRLGFVYFSNYGLFCWVSVREHNLKVNFFFFLFVSGLLHSSSLGL